HRRQQNRDDNQHTAHRRRAGFLLMRLGTFFTNVLADLKVAQTVDQPGTEEQADQQRRYARVRRPEGDVLKNIQHPQRRPVPVQRIQPFVKNVVQHVFLSHGSMLAKEARNVFRACSSFTPPDPLIRMTSHFFTIRASSSPPCTASFANFRRARSIPASSAPSRISVACPWTAMIVSSPDFAASRPQLRCISAPSGPSSS